MKMGNLSEQNWNFEKCLIRLDEIKNDYPDPENFLRDLRNYEYARSSPHVVQAFLNDRSNGNRIQLDGTWRCCLVAPGPDAFPDFDMCYAASPRFDDGFPEPPGRYDVGWLRIDELPYYDVIPIVAPAGFPDLPFLETDFRSISRELQRPLPVEKPVHDVTDYDGGYISSAWRPVDPRNVSHLHIDWDCSDDRLVESFRDWLRIRRNRPMIPQRGKSRERRYHRDLKALGVWRLLKEFGSFEDARASVSERDANNFPYLRKEDWGKAAKHAEMILLDFSMRTICG